MDAIKELNSILSIQDQQSRIFAFNRWKTQWLVSISQAHAISDAELMKFPQYERLHIERTLVREVGSHVVSVCGTFSEEPLPGKSNGNLTLIPLDRVIRLDVVALLKSPRALQDGSA